MDMYCVLRKTRTWFYSHVANVAVKKKQTLPVVLSDKILCSQCTQHTVCSYIYVVHTL